MKDILIINERAIETYYSLKELISNRMNRVDNTKVDSDIRKMYPSSYLLIKNGVLYDAKIGSLTGACAGESIQLEDDSHINLTLSIKLTNRVSQSEGQDTRYGFGADGNWYKQTSGKFVFSDASDSNLRNLGKAVRMDSGDVDLVIFNPLQKLSEI